MRARYLLALGLAVGACAQGVQTGGGGDEDDDGAGGSGASQGGQSPSGGSAGQGAQGGQAASGGIPEGCGDGVQQAGEGCDDGNMIDTDACPTTCVPASCGDSFVHEGVEECDDGNMVDTDACVAGCLEASCGDGFVESGVEECDDGNMVDTDDCVPGCLDAFCGDGFVESGVEECDDGGAVGGDGCSAICEDEGGSTFGPNHTFEALTSSFYITQFGCSNSGGDPGGDALWFCQHFYNAACVALPGWMAVSSSSNPMMHSGTNCYNPDAAGVPITGTSCIGGPCKIGNYGGPLGGLTNIVCSCP